MKMGYKEFLILTVVATLALAVTMPARAETLFIPIINGKVAAVLPAPVPDNHFPIEPSPIPQPVQSFPFRITSSRVDVRIDENVATTSMEQSFLNLTGRDLEVRVMIPLPAGAAINNSALSMNDQMVEGTLYDARQAQSIYESIVMQRRDPALLRFVGENLYEARVFPIPPNQERRLKFGYTQVLQSNGGLYDYKHILSGSQLYQGGIEKFQFECVIHSKTPLGPVYSPTHQVSIERRDERTAAIKLSGINLATDRDFRLYYAPSAGEIALRLVAHRASGSDDGYFMLLGRVDDQLEKSRILPKELVFTVDTSGSMRGEKMEQTKNALRFCLQSLSDQDRFNLISFSTDVNALSNHLLNATKENIQKALASVDGLEASGGTNIDGALQAALGNDFSDGPAKSRMVVFMTDGLPTVGTSDIQSILKNVQSANQKSRVHIFNFGVGNDVNTHLLDKMAADFDGVSSYVAPREDIEIKVSDFFSKIKHPVMTDINLDFGASNAMSVYPRRIPALYRGGEIMLLGRYKASGPGEVILTGNVGGEQRRITVMADWPARELDNSYLPRVWAMRKVGYLLEDLRLYGENQEIVREVTELAQRHGIVTPYTSQLVLEPGMQQNPNGRLQRGGERGFDNNAPVSASKAMDRMETAKKDGEFKARDVAREAHSMVSGDAAVALAEFERDLKDASAAPSEAAGFEKRDVSGSRRLAAALNADKSLKGDLGAGWKGVEAAAEAIQRAQTEAVKHIGARTFYHRDGIWIDSMAKSEAKPVVIKTFSKEYFELLKNEPALGPVLALGGRILVAVKDVVYQIEE